MSKKNKYKHPHAPPAPAAPPTPAPTPARPPLMSDANPPASTPTPAPDGSGPPADSRPQYEFDAAQNQVINTLALAIIWVRLPLLVAGLFQALIATGLAFRVPKDGAHIVGVLSHAVAAVVCFLLAAWLYRAADAFVRVTTTTGRDVSNLMSGLRNLASWFDLLAFFVKVYLFLLGVLLIVMLVGLLTGGGAFKGA